MPWHAQLDIDYSAEPLAGRLARTVARHRHTGPLRVLQSLYPEGDEVCHNVLVHPPGGLVGGDTLAIQVTAQGNAHGLITTPGATRFYRSEGLAALQNTHISLRDKARLEWLPLETLCYSGCLAENRLTLDLADESELIGWDITALGLPFAQQPFVQGSFSQHIEVPGIWLERGRINAADHRLLQSPAGLNGRACLASVFFISAQPLGRSRRQTVLDLARTAIATQVLSANAGATSPNEHVVVVRVLAPVVEPAMHLLKAVWRAWREALWAKSAVSPRIWST